MKIENHKQTYEFVEQAQFEPANHYRSKLIKYVNELCDIKEFSPKI